MFKILLRLFLFAHILGDFYFRNNELASKRRKNFLYLMLHGLVYLVVTLVCISAFYSYKLLLAALILAFSHFVIDVIKNALTKKEFNKTLVYVVDQLLHLFCILSVSIVLVYNNYQLKFIPPIEEFFTKTNIFFPNFLLWMLLMLLIIKPANISIKQLLENYKPKDDTAYGIKNAGAFIGILERLIILLLVSIQQYSAIGLVLTAKSVARYNRIAEDKQFAEYYLLGTLLSTLFALASYLLLV